MQRRGLVATLAIALQTVALPVDGTGPGRLRAVPLEEGPGAGRLILATAGSATQTQHRGESAITFRLRWQRVPGSARDLAIAANGAVYAVQTNGAVWRWDSRRKARSKWAPLPGALRRIAAAPDGTPWGIDPDARIRRFTGSFWHIVPGHGLDIAVGAKGAVFVIETDGTPARWNAPRHRWERLDGPKGQRIAVDPDDWPWIVTPAGTVMRYDGARWFDVPGPAARDIAIGPRGKVFTAGLDQRLRRWNVTRAQWDTLNGRVQAITVGPRGRPWAVGEAGQIYASAFFDRQAKAEHEARGSAEPLPTSRAPIRFEQLRGVAGRDIGIGRDGSVFLVDSDGFLLRFSNAERQFVKFPAALLRSVAVSPDGNPWVVALTGQIFRHDGTRWLLVQGAGITALEELGITGKNPLPRSRQEIEAFIKAAGEGRNAVDVGIGADGTVIASDANETLYRFDPKADRFERLRSAGNSRAPIGERVAVGPLGNPWVVRGDGTVFRCDQDPCGRVNGPGAIDIAIGPDGSVMIADRERRLRRFNPRIDRFERLDKGAQALAIGPRGRPWIVDARGRVWASTFFERDESRDRQIARETIRNTVQQLRSIFDPESRSVFVFTKSIKFEPVPLPPGAAPVRDIAISASGIVVVLDALRRINVFNPLTKTFQPKAATPLENAAVAPDGTVWGADVAFNVIRLEAGGVVAVPGLTRNTATPSRPGVAISPGGEVFATSPDNQLFKFDSRLKKFVKFPVQPRGRPDRVAVSLDGDPWVIDTRGDKLFEFTGSEFIRRPGQVIDIGIGASGAVFAVIRKSSKLLLRKWNATNKRFDNVNRTAEQVAVGPGGRPWIVDAAGTRVLRAK